MGLFEQFFKWIDDRLIAFIGEKTLLIAGAIAPAAGAMATIYVMVWGFMSLQGQIEEPLWVAVKRMLLVGVLLGCALHLWMFNAVLVDTFFRAPDELSAAIVGPHSTIGMIDRLWLDGNAVAEALIAKGSILRGDFSYYLAGFLVYVVLGLTVAYTAFLLALSKVAVAVILALGPLFMLMLFFDATKRFFESWIAQLANYALITILAMTVASLVLSVVEAYAKDAMAKGDGVTIADSARFCLFSTLILLVLRQVMPIASGLASGIALSSFGAVSGVMNWGLGTAKRTGYEFGRGVADGWSGEQRSRWDSIRRGVGNRVGAGLGSVRDGITEPRRGGNLVPRERVMPTHNWTDKS
jgi:type IV secretion system protein VirB6